MKHKTKKSHSLPEGKRVFSSMSATATGMQIPLPLLRRLKAAGSPGFELNGRCRESEILQFAASHPELLSTDGLPAGYDPLKTAQLEKLRFDLEIKKGKYELVDVTKRAWAQAMEAVMSVMQKLMTREDYNCAIRQIKVEIKALDL